MQAFQREPGTALLLAALLLAGCSGEASNGPLDDVRPSGVKVLIVGLDGATFDVANPLMKAGRMPALAGLIERGSRSRLVSEEPLKSPAIWTTIATGRPREEHGIEDFMAAARGTPEEPALSASIDRKTLALWDLAGHFELSSDVIGWWVTWPAEPLLGRMISDRVAHSRWASWAEAEEDAFLTYPPELYDEVRELIVDPLEPPMDELAALAEFTPVELEDLRSAPEPIPYHGPSVLKFGFCEQRTYEEIAFELIGQEQPDLALVFLIAIDPVSHTFWHYFEPEAFSPLATGGEQGGVDPEDARRLGPLIPALYEHADASLARLLELVDDDTVVIVVSDHGFGASGELPEESRDGNLGAVGIERIEPLERPVNVGMTGVHRLRGIFVAAGGPILPGAELGSQATVRDVAPTVLALMGLPVPDDLTGRVLEELIDPEFLREHPVRHVATYEGLVTRRAVDAGAAAGEDDDEVRRSYLRALGYTD